MVWRDSTGIEGELLWRNISLQFVKTADRTAERSEHLQWMLSRITATYEVAEGGAESYKLFMTTEEVNPLSVMAPSNTSYSCQEPRSATLLTFLIGDDSGPFRQLHSAIITMKWVHVVRPGSNLLSVCPQHGRDFVPRAVGFTLIGVVCTILIIYVVGRYTVEKKANYDSL